MTQYGFKGIRAPFQIFEILTSCGRGSKQISRFFFIAGFRCHAIKKSKPFNKSRIWETKEGKYVKILAEIQVSKISGEIHCALYGDAMLVPTGWAPTWRPEINRSVTEFCNESVKSPLKELLNSKVVFF